MLLTEINYEIESNVSLHVLPANPRARHRAGLPQSISFDNACALFNPTATSEPLVGERQRLKPNRSDELG